MSLTSLIGGKYQIKLGETAYFVSPISLKVEADFEQKLLAKTKASLQVMKDLVAPTDFFHLLKAVNDSYALGEYKLLGKCGLQALQTIDGLLMLLSMLFEVSEKEMLELVKKHMVEIKDLVKTILSESLGVSLEQR